MPDKVFDTLLREIPGLLAGIVILSIFAYIVFFSKKKGRFNISLLTLFSINYLGFIVLTWADDGIFSLASSFVYALKLFVADLDFNVLKSLVEGISSSKVLLIVASLLMIVSPVLGGAFILNFMKDITKSLSLWFNFSKNIYIFTELNDMTIIMAKSIKEKCRIIFLDQNGADKLLLKEECEANRYSIMSYSVEKLYSKIENHYTNKFSRSAYTQKISLFFADADENKALEKMISFIENKIENKSAKNIIKTSIYLFSISGEAEMIVDNYKTEHAMRNYDNITLRLIDRAQLISYGILSAYPLYEKDNRLSYDKSAKTQNSINVSIIGMGNVGTHIAKDILWCGQLPDTDLKLNLIDIKSREDLQSEFEHKFPELKKPDYDINYYTADVTSDKLYRLISDELSTSDYFVVSLGNDELNIMTSHYIRISYWRVHKTFPQIVAVVNDDDKYHAVESVFKKMNIGLAGSNLKIFSVDMLENNPLYHKAYRVDKAYGGTSSYQNFLNSREVIIRSNIAYAIHIDYKLWALTGLNPEKQKRNISDFVSKATEAYSHMAEAYEETEHLRWMAFQRSEGWISPFKSDDFKDDASLRASMERIKQENRFLCANYIDYLQSADKSKYRLNQTLFSKQHSCIIDFKYLELLGEVMKEDKNAYKKTNRKINDEMLSIWKEYANGGDAMYKPEPVNSDDISLSPEIEELAEVLAKNTHDVWAQGRMAEGWVYGDERNDSKKQTPCLVPYEELSETEKDYDRRTALETLKLIQKLGFEIKKK